MKTLVYDPFSGISGDMHMGAMVELGVPQEYLLESLEALSLKGWKVSFRREQRGSMTGTRAIVEVEEHAEVSGHGESHEHGHKHRGLKEIRRIIEDSSLLEGTKRRSMRMFETIAEAEAKVHGMNVDEIHFHEVGALDSIIDIVAAAAAIEYLAPERIISLPPELGGGFVECAHGLIPVPAPATVNILEGVPSKRGAVQKETTTPTGAAILKANVDEFIETASYRTVSTGYGVGSRELKIPNLLRTFIAESGSGGENTKEPQAEPSDAEVTEAVMMECNIDDMNPELYDHVLGLLYRAGAKEAYITPVQMKKNRPGTVLTVMSAHSQRERIQRILFLETTSAGIREYSVRQTMLNRSFDTVETPYGAVRVKHFYYDGECISKKPEYDDVRELAEKHAVPLRTVYGSIPV